MQAYDTINGCLPPESVLRASEENGPRTLAASQSEKPLQSCHAQCMTVKGSMVDSGRKWEFETLTRIVRRLRRSDYAAFYSVRLCVKQGQYDRHHASNGLQPCVPRTVAQATVWWSKMHL